LKKNKGKNNMERIKKQTPYDLEIMENEFKVIELINKLKNTFAYYGEDDICFQQVYDNLFRGSTFNSIEAYNILVDICKLKNKDLLVIDLREYTETETERETLNSLKNMIVGIDYLNFNWNSILLYIKKTNIIDNTIKILKEDKTIIFVHCEYGMCRTGEFIELLKERM
jgi:rhodanese-related sulfurtransferase